MSLITTCPHCGTSFKIAIAQLNARAGQVRCGRCSRVFDAYDSLNSPDGNTLPARPSPPQERERTVDPAQVTIVPGRMRTTTTPAASGPATLINPFLDEKKSRWRKKSSLRYEQNALAIVRPPRSRFSKVVLASTAALLILALIFQVLHYFRDAIVAHYPQARPVIEGFCIVARCRIDFLKKPDLLSIEASSLEADPSQPEVIVLRATLRNRASFPQAFPALELTLNDIKEQPVARRVFMPKEYRAGGSQSGGIEANAELAVQIRMQLINIKAQGYRLYLFYPRR